MGALDLRDLPLDAQLPDPPEDGGAALTERDHIEAAAGMAIARVRFGAMEAVDATVREARLAGVRARLEVIAEVLGGLPLGRFVSLSLGVTDEGREAVLALGGARQTHVYQNGTAIDGAELRLGRLQVSAQSPLRDATPDELAERERLEERAADVRLPPVVLS